MLFYDIFLKKSLGAIVKFVSLRFAFWIFICSIYSTGILQAENEKRPKTLVLIICSDNLPVYLRFQKIWKSYMNLDPEHFECYFIRGNPELSSEFLIDEDVVWSRTQENLIPGVLNKTLLSLEAFQSRLDEFDYILRANLSSFFIFPRLLNFLDQAPKQKFYCGIHHGYGTPDHESGWVCGAGIIMSTDLIKMLIANKERFLDLSPDDGLHIDDVVIGGFFAENNIEIKLSRYQEIYSLRKWVNVRENMPSDVFHFRVSTPSHTRLKVDIGIHKTLLRLFYGKKI